jgi:hypothetical protein
MPCEVVLVRVDFFKMAVVAMETNKILKNWKTQKWVIMATVAILIFFNLPKAATHYGGYPYKFSWSLMKGIKKNINPPFFVSMATAAKFIFVRSISRRCLDQSLWNLVGISYAMWSCAFKGLFFQTTIKEYLKLLNRLYDITWFGSIYA